MPRVVEDDWRAIALASSNYGQWFPNLLSQSQFNRRLRKLGQMLETLRRKWVQQLGGENATSFVIDTKPIPVMGYRRSKRASDFQASADADASCPSRLAAQELALFSPKGTMGQ